MEETTREQDKRREPYMIRDLIKQTFGDITISTATTEAFIYTLANNCYPLFVFFYNCTKLHMNKIQIFSTRTCQQSRKRRWNRVPKRGRDSRDGRKQGRLKSKTYVFTLQLDNLGPSILTKKIFQMKYKCKTLYLSVFTTQNKGPGRKKMRRTHARRPKRKWSKYHRFEHKRDPLHKRISFFFH